MQKATFQPIWGYFRANRRWFLFFWTDWQIYVLDWNSCTFIQMYFKFVHLKFCVVCKLLTKTVKFKTHEKDTSQILHTKKLVPPLVKWFTNLNSCTKVESFISFAWVAAFFWIIFFLQFFQNVFGTVLKMPALTSSLSLSLTSSLKWCINNSSCQWRDKTFWLPLYVT